MITEQQKENEWTNIRISSMTVRRLRVLKAQHDYTHFDELINKALDIFEGYDQTIDCLPLPQPCHKLKGNIHNKKKEKKQ